MRVYCVVQKMDISNRDAGSEVVSRKPLHYDGIEREEEQLNVHMALELVRSV